MRHMTTCRAIRAALPRLFGREPGEEFGDAPFLAALSVPYGPQSELRAPPGQISNLPHAGTNQQLSPGVRQRRLVMTTAPAPTGTFAQRKATQQAALDYPPPRLATDPDTIPVEESQPPRLGGIEHRNRGHRRAGVLRRGRYWRAVRRTRPVGSLTWTSTAPRPSHWPMEFYRRRPRYSAGRASSDHTGYIR